MPFLTVNDCRLFYRDAGQGPDTLVLGHGFLMTHRMWEPVVEAFQDRYRCVAPEWRGQGRTEVTRAGYGIPDLCDDLVALIEQLDLGPVHYAGHSMGGFVGLHLALRRPDLVRSLTLIDTQAAPDPPSVRRRHTLLLTLARLVGLRPVHPLVLPLLFGPTFRTDRGRRGELQAWKATLLTNDRLGTYRAGRGLLRRPDVTDRLSTIDVPTQVLVGEHDQATPVAASRTLAERIPDASLRIVRDAGHTLPVEQPEAVTDALEGFLATTPASS